MKLNRIFILAAIFTAFFTSCELEDELVSTIIKDDITTTTTWESGKVYVIQGSISVDNTTLTIQPGTRIEFEAGASLHIGYYGNATLIANGTAEKPIIFTSNASTPSAGAWEGITFWSHSLNSSMKYCSVKFAGTTSKGAVNINDAMITFSNNLIQNAKLYGLLLDDGAGFTEMNNNTIEDCGSHPIRLHAAYMHTIGTGNTFTCPDDKGVNIVSDDVTGNITWKKLNKPYYVEGSIDIDNGTLTIEPGAVFKFNSDGVLHIGYYNNTTFIANGNSAEKILFTTSAASPSAGSWAGLHFWDDNLATSSMTYCEVAYAGKSSVSAIKLNSTSLTFSNNSIHHAMSKGMELDESEFVEMNNNTIENVGSHAVEIPANYVHTIGTGNVFTCGAGYGIDVTYGDITSASTWKKLVVPYYINVSVNVNGNLTIQPGSILKFGADGKIHVGYYQNAVLTANGTTTEPIIFTSSASSPAAGAWEGIYLWDNSNSSNFNYCEFLYAGNGSADDRAAIMAIGSNFSVTNSKFKNSDGWGIYYDAYSTLTQSGNTFESCAFGDIGFDTK
ncbi:MAG: hypothetical protein F9K37_01115 [Bacteroidales bacterium]|nr:MAG: hypothetical protein F9K37_01115 [Bacteroidales bacterium]